MFRYAYGLRHRVRRSRSVYDTRKGCDRLWRARWLRRAAGIGLTLNNITFQAF
ncbi:MAG: hypothetical protein ACRDEA_19650 [Microcystaceae cyanobacterium]